MQGRIRRTQSSGTGGRKEGPVGDSAQNFPFRACLLEWRNHLSVWVRTDVLCSRRRSTRGTCVWSNSIHLTVGILANFRGIVLGCIEAIFASKLSIVKTRWKTLDEIYQICMRPLREKNRFTCVLYEKRNKIENDTFLCTCSILNIQLNFVRNI